MQFLGIRHTSCLKEIIPSIVLTDSLLINKLTKSNKGKSNINLQYIQFCGILKLYIHDVKKDYCCEIDARVWRGDDYG